MRTLSLKQKLFITIAMVVVSYAILSVLFIDIYVNNVLRSKRITQGNALVATIASHVADPLLIRDYLAIDEFFDSIRRTNPDVAYIFIEQNDQVLLHTFQGGFPQKLLSVGHRKTVVDYVVVVTNEGTYYDFAAPVFGGRAGTLRLGVSPEADNMIMKATKKSLLYVALGVLAVALGITALISRRLTAPLSRLTQSASAMAKGDFSMDLCGEGDDEVCRLAQAMGRMAQAVKVRERELLEINEELEAVNVRLHEYIGELQRTRDELVKTKQDAAVVDTARAFLHHARQPLTYLIMAIELMTDDLAADGALNPETMGGRLQAVQDASVRLSDLLRKFEQLKTYHPIEYDGTTKILDIDK